MRLPERIEAKIARRTDGCWLWLGAVSGNGYGYVFHEGRIQGAHRVVFQILRGATTESLDHLCRQTRCVNPDHLEPVDHRTNVLRGIGPAAKNAAKTHCKQGHPLSGDNLSRANRHGHRVCRTCKRAAIRRWYRKHRKR